MCLSLSYLTKRKLEFEIVGRNKLKCVNLPSKTLLLVKYIIWNCTIYGWIPSSIFKNILYSLWCGWDGDFQAMVIASLAKVYPLSHHLFLWYYELLYAFTSAHAQNRVSMFLLKGYKNRYLLFYEPHSNSDGGIYSTN